MRLRQEFFVGSGERRGIGPAAYSFRRLLLLSFEMNLPGAERAVVDIDKLRDYCLNPLHPEAAIKRVFSHRLCPADEVTEGEADEYGEALCSDFECVKGDRSAIIRSGWIVLRGESVPRLTACYLLSE